MQRLFTDTHLSVYRRSGGRVMGWFDTAPILLLTTEGRRSKRLRTVPVMYVPGEYPALVASNGGARQHPQWYRNLKANPQATIQIGAEAFVVWAEDAAGSERDALWARAVECYPAYARYQRNTSRVIPVVALRPSRR
jgi:deazaflavin-dependent oxidoreductase (nitroreductase family)